MGTVGILKKSLKVFELNLNMISHKNYCTNFPALHIIMKCQYPKFLIITC